MAYPWLLLDVSDREEKMTWISCRRLLDGRLHPVSECISAVEMACMVYPYGSEGSLPLHSFGWQWWRRRLSNSFGPLSSAGHTPEDKRFKLSAYLWSPEKLTKDRQCLRQATMILSLMYVLDN